MSSLFIHVYLDQDVNILVANLLLRRGFQATTALEAQNLEENDPYQLAYATANGMAILTHNRDDFELLAQEYFTHGKDHAGIFIAVRRSPTEIVRRLAVILNEVTADEMANQVRYL